MNDVLAVAVPSAIGLVGMLVITLAFAAMLAWPRLLLLGLVACLVVFPQSSSYGLEDASDAGVFYVKGSKTFFFTFIEMGLFGGWLATLVRQAWTKAARVDVPLLKYYAAFGALLLGNFLVGLADPNRFSILDLSQRGYSNLVWQGMLVYIIAANIRTERDLRDLAWVVLVCIAARQGFGIVRYVFFGGDPQNAYATIEQINVRITFWDVNDSILAAFALGYCAWKALVDESTPSRRRWMWALGGLIVIGTTMLTARRTAQGGMLLAIVAVLWLIPRGRRWPLVLATAVTVPLLLMALAQRSGAPGASLTERLLIDVKTDRLADPRRSRFHEFETAWQTLKNQPILGVGPSGSFEVRSHIGLEYHAGKYDYVHSGFGQIFLKAGLVGLALYLALLGAWLRCVVRGVSSVAGVGRGVYLASVAALSATVPTLLFGTPIGELRTMLVMAVALVAPFVLQNLGRAANDATAPGKWMPSASRGMSARAFRRQ